MQQQYSDEDLLQMQQLQDQQQLQSLMPQPNLLGQQRYNSDFTKSLYETDDMLVQIDHFLRGKIKNAEGEFIKVYEPIMSEEGINLLIGDLRFHINKVTFLSNLREEDVWRIALESRKMIIRWLY